MQTKSNSLDRTLKAIGLVFCVFIVWLWPVLIVWLVRRCRSRSQRAVVNVPPVIATTPLPLPPIIPPPLPPVIGDDGGQSPASDEMSFAA
jgi:hypothetical protein